MSGSASKPRRLQHTLLHTRLSLDLCSALPSSSLPSQSRTVYGRAELVYQLLSAQLRFVTFCCRAFSIDAVLVNGVPSSWTTVGSTLFPSLSALADARDVRSLELCFDDEADCALSGNVWVKIPKKVRDSMKERERKKSRAHEDVDITGDSGTDEERPVTLIVAVHYRVHPQCKGLEWWTARGAGGGVTGEDVCLTVTAAGDASLWMPCMDATAERGTYELELIVPADMQAVASGRLTERRYDDAERSRVRFAFVQERPVASRCIGWAVGRFMLDVDERVDWASCFFPAAALDAFTYTMTAPGSLSTIIRLFEAHLNVFPFPFLHVVFCSTRTAHVFSGLLLLPLELLTDHTLIDPVYVTRRRIAYHVALCWLTALVLDSPAEDWITLGLAGLLSLQFVEKTLGHSESEYLAMRWSCELCREDADAFAVSDASKLIAQPVSLLSAPEERPERAVESRPLCWAGYTHPSELVTRTARHKAALVMLMLQAKTGPDTFQQITRRLIDDHSERSSTAPTTAGAGGSWGGSAGAAAGGAVVLPLSTAGLCELVKDVSADVDVGSFFTQWVHSDGYPVVEAYFSYNAKKKATVVLVDQMQCAFQGGLRFEGAMKFVIHESERRTEQERRVELPRHDFEFSCVSRVRRNRKRKQYDRDALLHLPLEKLLMRHNDTPVLWVRCDVLHAFLQPVDVVANEVMLSSQLQAERDVRGQLEAICALWRLFLNPQGSNVEAQRMALLQVDSVEAEGLHLGRNALKNAFHDAQCFYRVRLLAARVLAMSSSADASDSSSRAVLLDWLTSRFVDEGTGEWRANDFTNVAEYFLKKGVALELSRAYITEQRLTPAPVLRLLLTMLQSNDNEKNAFSDAHYVADLLLALGNACLADTETHSRAAIVALLKRHLAHDQVLPSHQRIVTQAALTAGITFQVAHHMHEPLLHYADYLDPFYPAPVRVAAFRCVLLLSEQQPASYLQHLLAVFSECDAHVQQAQLHAWCELVESKRVALTWVRSPTSAAAIQLSDAMWSALLSTSSAPCGFLPPTRTWLLRLYKLCFGMKRVSLVATVEQRRLSDALHTALLTAVEERKEQWSEAQPGGKERLEWRSTSTRKSLAAQALASQRAGRETQAGVSAARGGDSGSRRVGKFILSTRGGELKARQTLVLGDDGDDEWHGRD